MTVWQKWQILNLRMMAVGLKVFSVMCFVINLVLMFSYGRSRFLGERPIFADTDIFVFIAFMVSVPFTWSLGSHISRYVTRMLIKKQS